MHESFYREAHVAIVHLHGTKASHMSPYGGWRAVLPSLSSNSVYQRRCMSTPTAVDVILALALTHTNDKAGSTAAATA